MSNATTPDTSVMFSLAELANLEQERVEEETRQHADLLAQRARAERLAQQQAERNERARVEAAAEAERQQAFAEAEAEARREARAQAAVEVARIEAEGKARLEADNATRAHELALLREKSRGGALRWRRGFAALLGASLLLGSAAAYGVNDHVTQLQNQTQRVRDDRFQLVQAHDKGMASALMALDRRHESLQARSVQAKVSEALQRASAARDAIDAGGVDQAKLQAFADAVDALDVELDYAEQLTALDKRLADLDAWAQTARRSELVDAARSAASKAHASSPDRRATLAYGAALDTLAQKLAMKKSSAATGSRTTVATPQGKRCTDPHDPLCDLNGNQIGLP